MTESLDKMYPQIYDRFILMDLIGSGGMGQVFRAVTLDEINRVVVVKKIYEHFRTNASYVRMFRDEIKVLSMLNHPNIVHMYNHGSQGEYLEMEFVRGLSVNQILEHVEKQSEKIPIEIVVYICHEAAKALGYAHDLRDDTKSMPLEIVHRDISPHNMMLTYKGSVKVLDFGISKFSDKVNITEVGVVKGKRNYISPEQNRGEKVGPAADIYSLGAVLWRMLTGRPAFDADNPEQYAKIALQDNIKPPSHYNAQVPASLDRICLKALKAKPEERLRTMMEFQTELLNISKEINRENSIVRKTSEWMQSTFKSQMLSDEEKLRSSLNKASVLSKEYVDRKEQTVPMQPENVVIASPVDDVKNDKIKKPLIYAALAIALLIAVAIFIRKTDGPLSQRSSSGETASSTVDENVEADLQLLAEQGMFQEALAGLTKVPPRKRLPSWRDLVVRVVKGHAANLAKSDVMHAFEFLKTEEQAFPFIIDNSDYQIFREDIGMKWFERCAPGSLDCVDILIPFISAVPNNYEFAFKAGVRTTYHYFHYSGLTFFKMALEGPQRNEYCKEERLISAVDGGLSHSKDSKTGKLARDIAAICNIKAN